MRHLVSGVVHKDVNFAELLNASSNDLLAMPLFLDVSRYRDYAPSCFLNDPRGFSRVLMFVKVGDNYISALTSERDGDRASDATIRSGNDRYTPH
jgi:hypothetical protein